MVHNDSRALVSQRGSFPLFSWLLLPAVYGGIYSKNRPFSIHFSPCSLFYPGSCCKKCCNHSKGMIAGGFDAARSGVFGSSSDSIIDDLSPDFVEVGLSDVVFCLITHFVSYFMNVIILSNASLATSSTRSDATKQCCICRSRSARGSTIE